MSEWIDVPVADVQVGDEVKVDGYGKHFEDSRAHDFNGSFWDSVSSVRGLDVSVTLGRGPVPGPHVSVRRSSIVSARRRKPEPQPQPGDWRCGHGYKKPDSTPDVCYGFSEGRKCERGEVFRASGGWSRDTRTGQPWVMQNGDPVEVVIPARIADISGPLRNADDTYMRVQKSVDESWADYYKRIGLDVRPADRRGKR